MGVSFDPPGRNRNWAEEEGFQFELWTDDDVTLALTYGAASSDSAPYAQRVTVVLGPDGEHLLEYAVSDFGTHPAQVLDDCTALFGE